MGTGLRWYKMTTSVIWNCFFAVVITVVVGVLVLLCATPIRTPAIVLAGDPPAAWLYVAPGVTNVITPDGNRRFLGKVAIDLRNGNIWGLPTLQPAPYPRDHTSSTPPTVEPVFLGRYDRLRHGCHIGSQTPARYTPADRSVLSNRWLAIAHLLSVPAQALRSFPTHQLDLTIPHRVVFVQSPPVSDSLDLLLLTLGHLITQMRE